MTDVAQAREAVLEAAILPDDPRWLPLMEKCLDDFEAEVRAAAEEQRIAEQKARVREVEGIAAAQALARGTAEARVRELEDERKAIVDGGWEIQQEHTRLVEAAQLSVKRRGFCTGACARYEHGPEYWDEGIEAHTHDTTDKGLDFCDCGNGALRAALPREEGADG